MPNSLRLSAPSTVAADSYSRADLLVYGVRHDGPSFEARVFLNQPGAGADTPLTVEAGYAGSFRVFGHGWCTGSSGHCDVPRERRSFDRRRPHHLTPYTKRVVVTDGLRFALRENDSALSVTFVPIVRSTLDFMAPERVAEPLRFDRVELALYA
jgi:hypothetical protein